MLFETQVGEWARKNLCVDDTGLVPTVSICFGGFEKPVSHISSIFEFCRSTLVVFCFLIGRGDYRVLLQSKLASNWSKEMLEFFVCNSDITFSVNVFDSNFLIGP